MMSLFEKDDIVEEAIDFLKKNEPEEGYYLCFSGGKDSIVCKQLMILSGVKWVGGYAFPCIDPPEIVKYIKEYHSDIQIIPSPSFMKNVIKKGPPTIMRRWCCDTQKKQPQKEIGSKYRVMGIRAEESSKRAKRGKIHNFKKFIDHHPIFDWKEWEVWEFIEKQNLPYCELYDIPMIHRIGCCICPFQSGQERKFSQIRWPGYWKAYKRALFRFWERLSNEHVIKLHETGDVEKYRFHLVYPTFEEFWFWLGEKGEWKPKSKAKNNLKLDLDKL
jgi:phosphoadenosine phosphosulfate reductase